MLDLSETGRRVAELRRLLGVRKQEDLGAAVGVSRSAIANIESGGERPGLVLAVALADYFRVPLDFLLARTVPPGGPLVGQFVDDPDELALIRFWRSLSHAEKAAALRMLRIKE